MPDFNPNKSAPNHSASHGAGRSRAAANQNEGGVAIAAPDREAPRDALLRDTLQTSPAALQGDERDDELGGENPAANLPAPPAPDNAASDVPVAANAAALPAAQTDGAAPAQTSQPANNNSARPAPAQAGTDDPAKEKEEKDKEATEPPIKRRAAAAGDDQAVAKVEALNFEGSSDAAVGAFTEATASQMAASHGKLGEAVNQKLGSEKQDEVTSAPKLTASTTGAADPKSQKANDPGSGKNAAMGGGVTEGEPGALKPTPHHDKAGLPGYGNAVSAADRGKPKEKSGSWWSWLTDRFKNLMGGVSTTDSGVNTKAGPAPKVNTTGKANPNRADNMRSEGNTEVGNEKTTTKTEIANHPGQGNVQPLYFSEEKPTALNQVVATQATTQPSQDADDYLALPLPEDVRAQADLDMAPLLDKSMAEPRKQAKEARKKRDGDKQAAITKAETDAELLNQQAEADQNQAVKDNRKKIADEQQRGQKEAEDQLKAYNTEADKEQKDADRLIKDRIKKDQGDADKKLRDAEKDAEAKRKEGERKAAEEKRKAKQKSKKKSWWGRFKDTVASAVSWLTDKIKQVFDAVRKAVKFVIDKAKEAAVALIEAGRKWIVDKLDKFGTWLKSKVNKYLKHFPALRKRVNKFIDDTVEGAKKVVNQVADGLKKGVEALADGLTKALDKVLEVFETALTAAVQIAGAVLTGDFGAALKIAFMAACKIAGIDPNPVLDFFNRAGEAIGKIFKDPAAFFTNVGRGVGQGIDQFVTNIRQHLLNGLIGWLTGAMSDVPIQLPEKWDLKGIFSLVMQVLGLTYDNIRAKVVKRIGPNGEEVVSGMEKTFEFVVGLVKNGPIFLWEKIKEKFGEIKEMAMEKIKGVVTFEVVKAGVKWILSLLNPASAIVKAVLGLFDLVMFLIERKDQVVGFVTAVYDTVVPLVNGQVGKAANAVEGAMAKSIPMILGLLSSLLGLNGIGKSVQKVLQAVRKPVDKVVDPIINWIVDKGKNLYAKGKKFVKGKLSGKDKARNDKRAKQTPQEREANKKKAHTAIKKQVEQGIAREDLLAYMKKVQNQYSIQDITLNKDDDVVVTNSPPIKVKAKTINLGLVQEDPKAKLTPQEKNDIKNYKKSSSLSAKISLGQYSVNGDKILSPLKETKDVMTANGVSTALANQLPFHQVSDQYYRPKASTALLRGVYSGTFGQDKRDSSVTTIVGYRGNVEYFLRKGKSNTMPGNRFQGGHIVGNQFGGPERDENLTPQKSIINQRYYSQIESFVEKQLPKKDIPEMTFEEPPALKMDINMNYAHGAFNFDVGRFFEAEIKAYEGKAKNITNKRIPNAQNKINTITSEGIVTDQDKANKLAAVQADLTTQNTLLTKYNGMKDELAEALRRVAGSGGLKGVPKGVGLRNLKVMPNASQVSTAKAALSALLAVATGKDFAKLRAQVRNALKSIQKEEARLAAMTSPTITDARYKTLSTLSHVRTAYLKIGTIKTTISDLEKREEMLTKLSRGKKTKDFNDEVTRQQNYITNDLEPERDQYEANKTTLDNARTNNAQVGPSKTSLPVSNVQSTIPSKYTIDLLYKYTGKKKTKKEIEQEVALKKSLKPGEQHLASRTTGKPSIIIIPENKTAQHFKDEIAPNKKRTTGTTTTPTGTKKVKAEKVRFTIDQNL